MKKVLSLSLLLGLSVGAFAQWSPSKFKGKQVDENVDFRNYYSLDLNSLRSQLQNAQESGQTATPVVISLPTLGGKMERFKVYSAPVVVKELADQYQLGSYAGVGIDDPSKFVRFSLSPSDFQGMMVGSNGRYDFISPVDKNKTVYGVHPKTNNTGSKPFVCSTEEAVSSVNEIQNLANSTNTFSNRATDFSRSSDKKFRTMRLVMSVTGEYTAYHGGTVAGALSAINATLTRVNGVFEKDFALRLILQNFPGVIYTDASTDPYSPAAQGAGAPGYLWSTELQSTLTANVGNANYDIGHLFGASGGGGMAGCIGCVCIDPTAIVPRGKGSGYTSPANAIPMGDTFDIDYVAHEMGHQLGGNHTFSHALEGSGTNVEPGSGSTIMGYAGITGGNTTDIQPNSDAYFHKVSIGQVQTNLNSKTCDVETTIANNPPVITALPNVTIPKQTAFVLSATVTDPENDPMTFTWEQGDTAYLIINSNNLGSTSSGASFRSVKPTNSPVRYFPKWESVLAGVLNNANNTWESVSQIARTSNYTITARDNNANVTEQQTSTANQVVTVGNDGPFQVTTTYGYNNAAGPITWDVVNTNNTPYNVQNVKIEFSKDNGATWTTLSASTPNDGSENIQFPASVSNEFVIVKVSAVGNVFYAIKKVYVTNQVSCDGSPVSGVLVPTVGSTTANIQWAPVVGAVSYVIEYKKTTETVWSSTTSTTNTVALSNLADGTVYNVKISAVCSSSTGTPSNPVVFITDSAVTYCTPQSTNATEDYISNVTLANLNNSSLASNYTNYGSNADLIANLVKGQAYTVSVGKGWLSGVPRNGSVAVWIDFNKNGTFESTEKVMSLGASMTTPVTASFTVPATAVTGSVLKMRVVLTNAAISPIAGCLSVPYGEVEDYSVVVNDVLGLSEVSNSSDISIYPNPAVDVINITNVKDKTAYSIHSATGQLVQNGTIEDSKVNVSKLIKGVYVITIGNGNSVKFVKK